MKFYILFALFAIVAAEPAMEQEWTAEYGKYGVDAVLPLTTPLYYRGYPGYIPTRTLVRPEYKAYPHGFKATFDPEFFYKTYGFYPPY